MCSVLVVNLLILRHLFPVVECYSHSYSLNRTRSNYTLPPLFDHVSLPLPGILPILNRKIFRGRRVSIREHPYVASIRRHVAHYSVGCILTKNVILTVAHPLINVSIADLSVVVGENYADRGSIMLTIILIVVHKYYSPSNLQNDIALLRVFEDITYKGSSKSIPLIRSTESMRGRKAFVTGWGRCDRTGTELCLPRSTRYTLGEKLDPMLRTVTFSYEENNVYCDMYRNNGEPLPPGMLCVGVAREQNPMAQCLAVPGAPLVIGARLTGILSWGFGCGHEKDLPLVYTDAQYYQPWLVHNILILRGISKVYLLKLFQAKRANVLNKWLSLTRVVTPNKGTAINTEMTSLRVDRELAKLLGDVYDIRDVLYDGAYHEFKFAMYAKLREKFATDAEAELIQKDIEFWLKKRNETSRPFINAHSEDSDTDSVVADAEDANDVSEEDFNNGAKINTIH